MYWVQESDRLRMPYHTAPELMYGYYAMHTLQTEDSPSLAVKCHCDKALLEIRVRLRAILHIFRASAAHMFCGAPIALGLVRQALIRPVPA